MKMKSLCKYVLLLPCLGLMCGASYAEKKESEQIEPPQEIFDACKDKSVGEACFYYNNFSRKIKGTCLKDTRTVLCIDDPEPVKKE